MALKKAQNKSSVTEVSQGTAKAKDVFKTKSNKEIKKLTTFSIEPSFKAELEELFDDKGLGWAAGIRFALKEFIKKHGEN